MANKCRTTSVKMAHVASKALRDGRSSNITKSLAGTALSQHASCKHSKKR